MMQIIDKYGMEIELVDMNRNKGLPDKCTWNTSEKTLVNSDGSWVDVNSTTNTIGGEINTEPTTTIVEQLDIFKSVMDYFPEANINYRCNLHIHISLMPQFNTLSIWKQLLMYFQENYFDIIAVVMPYFKRPKDMTVGMHGRLIERDLHTHIYNALIRADTKDEFFDRFFIKKNGNIDKRTGIRRAYVNFFSLKKHGTIEFRCFYSTKELLLVESCFKAIENCIHRLFSGGKPDWSKFQYPPYVPYDHNLELAFKQNKK